MPFENHPILYKEQGEASTYVKKKYWNCGIGKALLIEIMAMLPQSSIKCFFGKVMTANEAAVKLARQLGWEFIGTIPPSLKEEKTPEIMLFCYNVPAVQ